MTYPYSRKAMDDSSNLIKRGFDYIITLQQQMIVNLTLPSLNLLVVINFREDYKSSLEEP